MSSRLTKSWVHIQLEKKEKERRVLKYFQVKNDVMSFMELRGRRWWYFRHEFLLKVQRDSRLVKDCIGLIERLIEFG